MGFPHSSVGKESDCKTGDPSSIPGLGRSAGERIGYPLHFPWTSLVTQASLVTHTRSPQGCPISLHPCTLSSNGKGSACDAGDQGSIPGLGSSYGEGDGNPLQYSCLENSTDRSLAGYSPWDHKESETTERLTHARTYFKFKPFLFLRHSTI